MKKNILRDSAVIDLSIVVPVYNVQDYLKECLDSIYAIKLINIEVIIVNDGSTDSSQQIIDIYERVYKDKTKVIKQNNKGLSGARNTGIRAAEGKYIIFIDSDDYVDANEIEKIFMIGKEDELDIMFFNFEYFGPRATIKKMNFENYSVIKGNEFFEELYDYKNNFINVEVCTNIFKRAFLEENSLVFVEKLLHEDTLFMFKAMYFADKVRYFNEDAYKYRYRENSIMNSQTEKNYRHKLFIADELLKFKILKSLNNKSWDNIIMTLIFAANKNCNIKNNELNRKVKLLSNLTVQNKIKRFINTYVYRFKGKNLEIEV